MGIADVINGAIAYAKLFQFCGKCDGAVGGSKAGCPRSLVG